MNTQHPTLNINLSSVFSILYSEENQTPEEAKKVKMMTALLSLDGFHVSMGSAQFFDVLDQGGVSPDIMKVLRLIFEERKTQEKETEENLDIPIVDAVKNDPEEKKVSQEEVNSGEHVSIVKKDDKDTVQNKQASSENDLYIQIKKGLLCGDVDAVKKLLGGITREQIKQTAEAENFEYFQLSCTWGLHGIVNLFLEIMTPEQKKRVLETENFCCLRWACQVGHAAKVVELLLDNMTTKQKNQVFDTNNSNFLRYDSGPDGYNTVDLLLKNMTPERKIQTLEEGSFRLLKFYCFKGYIEIVKLLLKNMTADQVKRGVESGEFYCLKISCVNKNLDIAKLLFSQMTEEQQKRIPRDTLENFLNLSLGN